MARTTTPSFVYTLKLRYCDSQRCHLDKMFRAANKLYNDLVRDRLPILQAVESDPQYQSIMAAMRAIYANKALSEKQQRKQLKPWGKARNKLLQDAGLSEYGFQKAMQRFRYQYGKKASPNAPNMFNSQVANQVAVAVWRKFASYLFDSGKRIGYRKWEDCKSIETSASDQGIVFKGDRVMIGKGFEIKVKLQNTDYERACLEHHVKYCRIVRIPWKKEWLYKLQLTLEGTPPVITKKGSDEPKHQIGKGRVGLDIGLADIAVVGDDGAMVPPLAPHAEGIDREIAEIQRKLDQSRRQSNPDFFDKKGRIIPINQLPPERLNRFGKRDWRCSNNYRRLDQRRRYLQAKVARIRKHDHQELANKILEYGDRFFVEKMRWDALAKKAKLTRKANGQCNKRKRFGKSILRHAPGTLLTVLEEKVLKLGGEYRKIDTWSAKASQYNHLTKEYKKVPLGQRWKLFTYNAGFCLMQRDLYSAFLLSCMNDDLNGFVQKECEAKFDNFLRLQERAVRERSEADPRYQRSKEKFLDKAFPTKQLQLVW